jgi:hypothetical protein
MWYEVVLPKGIGMSASPHELTDKAWRMKNAVWKDGAIEDIEIPIGLLYNTSNTNPIVVDINQQAHDVCRVVGYKGGTNNQTAVTAFATENRVKGFDQEGNEVISLYSPAKPYRLLPYSLTKNVGIMIFGQNRFYFDGNTVRQLGDNILTKPPTPSVGSALWHSEMPIEYRYKVVFANTALGFVSPPSDPVGCFGLYNPYVTMSGSNKEKDFAIYLHPNVSGAAPTDIDKVFIYRWTEIVGVYVKLAEVTVSDWWSMNAYQDTTPADFVSDDVLGDAVGIPTDTVTALGTINGRVVYGMDNKIYISEPLKPFWMDADTPIYVLDSTIENIFRWGSHLLVQTRFGWYRLLETENGFVLQPLTLPLPTSRTAVRKTRAGIVILSWRGAFVFTPDERLLHFPLNSDMIEGQRLLTRPSYVRVMREYVDIVLSDGRYFRVNQEGEMSGLHDRLKVYAWGE